MHVRVLARRAVRFVNHKEADASRFQHSRSHVVQETLRRAEQSSATGAFLVSCASIRDPLVARHDAARRLLHTKCLAHSLALLCDERLGGSTEDGNSGGKPPLEVVQQARGDERLAKPGGKHDERVVLDAC